jgi:putative spermidine/putrescine transport system substrate-binding protein
MRRFLRRSLLLALRAVLAAGVSTGYAGPAQAQAHEPAPLVVANFGGANGQAQAVAFVKPFRERHGVAVKAVEYTGDLAALKARPAGAPPAWDVVEVESTDLALGCAAGLFERIDRASVASAGMLIPGTLQECGVGAFVWSTVLAYDAGRLKEAPKNWADFFDVQRFPGKRALRKGARYNLEIALLADGVHRRDVYAQLATPAGQERAWSKLQALLPHVRWWDAGAQPVQWLASGEVAMASAFNGRVAVAAGQGARLGMVWADAIYEFDYWTIVKGTPRRAQAEAFISFATSEAAQLAFAREISYGPTHFGAIMKVEETRQGRVRDAHNALIDLSMAASDLPSAPANLRIGMPFNAAFWATNGAAIEKRLGDRLR